MRELVAAKRPTPSIELRTWSHRGRRRSFPEYAHDTFEVGIVERGHVRYAVGTKTLDAGPGAIVIVPASVGHATSFESDVRADAFQVCAARVAAVAEAAGIRAPRDPIVLADDERARALCRFVREESATDRPAKELAIDALTEALIVEVLRCGATGPGERIDPRIRRALDLVESCYEDALTVDDLARAAAMSRFHFSRCFRSQIGMSPYRYVQHVRVGRAAPLLAAGRSVMEVAYAVGFTDASRFARAFRREMGCAPHEWRRCA